MTVLSLTWESPYLERRSLYWDGALAPGIHFTKGSWSHNWNLVKNTIICEKYLDYDYSDPMRSQICICHDSSAVMACAKSWDDWILIFQVTVTSFFLSKFGLWAHELFVKLMPGIGKCDINCKTIDNIIWIFFLFATEKERSAWW